MAQFYDDPLLIPGDSNLCENAKSELFSTHPPVPKDPGFPLSSSCSDVDDPDDSFDIPDTDPSEGIPDQIPASIRPKPGHLGGVLCQTASPTSTTPSISSSSPADSSTASEQSSHEPPPSSTTDKASDPTVGSDSCKQATPEIRHASSRFVHDKPLENYYRILLRRRGVQITYHDRKTAVSGGRRPGAEWRWCGFDKCSKEACRYIGGVVDVENPPVLLLAPVDLEADYHLLRELIFAFEAAGLHHSAFVAFATSPPVVRAMAEYISSVIDGKGVLTKCFWVEGVLDEAAEKFKGEGWARGPKGTDDGPPTSLTSQGSADRHDEPSFYQHGSETDTARDLMFREMMRLDAWRRRQVAAEAYPWDWGASGAAVAAAAYKIVIGAYREAYGRGYVVLRDADQNAQDRMWTLWWDRFRPWTECKGPFVADLEAADMGARHEAGRGDDGEEDEKDDEQNRATVAPEVDLYEGVGRYKASWWPNQPRAPGVDLSLEH
ncbi:hypothetical protein CH63R_00122 [Colletotrichum higginsianum IMI 349063]|uniref:Uncharacterized protein n=1 Tax=Colletotrichum higginsianum (strain IMI 349063) TaxID=759273 RepID=A0A1B7YSK4_COLHI|nr:hypothetical protein CH63R_00122 [Colletotrichum higginsianum IMI 349063]OBR14942.1 hypothetical protein CH63R_00122 [Colletotrichum higginsianum IMI 349063]